MTGGARCFPVYDSPAVKRCPGCGGALYRISVQWGVWEHRGDGRYRLADAVKLYATRAGAESAAERAYRANSASTLVSRSISLPTPGGTL
jgi:hypothetical protein